MHPGISHRCDIHGVVRQFVLLRTAKSVLVNCLSALLPAVLVFRLASMTCYAKFSVFCAEHCDWCREHRYSHSFAANLSNLPVLLCAVFYHTRSLSLRPAR
eukprot:TRINITY_DN12868_c0_g1_i2.p2 TRINITY_DN12868_c0_g1~~TRINITY_DN12868_c0_g1_i2.p2  ORF type:complete len:101 (-),score=5.07 TRINITY_DN12868_c0_g1_i2:32-334(-)